jgi:transposase
LPPPAPCGRTRETALRDVVDAIIYIAQSGCQWRMLPKDFPSYSTVQRYFYAWRDSDLWQTINHKAGTSDTTIWCRCRMSPPSIH